MCVEGSTVMEKVNGRSPIGIFDSGVGGLTVMREISRQLPGENIVYFGDTARVPYGSKSKKNIIRFSRQIIRFLMTKDVKAIVIACNTASALAMDEVRAEFSLPIMGVVEPGAQAAVQTAQDVFSRKGMYGTIGVIGTDGTVKSDSYRKAICRLNPYIRVISMACPLFVPLVEEGFSGHPVAEQVIAHYLEPMCMEEPDALILGCTHYPLLQNPIHQFMGESVTIVNPAYETAVALKNLLEREQLLSDRKNGEYAFYVSDGAAKFQKFANTVMPFAVPKTNVVNIEEFS